MPVIKKRSTPDVYLTERDISNIVVPAGTSTGAVVVRSKKGPIARPVFVTSDQEYTDTFGDPVFTSGTSVSDTDTPEMGYGQYAALVFLGESDSLYVVRDFDTGDKFAAVVFDTSGTYTNSGIAAAADANNADKINYIYALETASITGNALLIGSVGPGLDGNNTAVTIETCHSACDWFNSYDDYTSATDLSAHAIAADVFKINVYRKTDSEVWANLSFADFSASPVETWYGSRSSLQDGAKNQLRISDVVNGNSQYIYVVPGTADFGATAFNTTPSSIVNLSGGALVYGTNLTATDGLSYFESKEETSINILMVPTYSMAVKIEAARIASVRKDCIAVGQSGQRIHTTIAQIKTAETYGYATPSYVALYAGTDKFYDKYNDKYVWLPKCIYGAALMARCDRIANTWDAPMGVTRGILPSEGQYKTFKSSEIGQLYDANINTSKNFRGIGDVMWGQKTAQLKSSALDRINVRRLLLFLENSTEIALLPFIGEPNNTETRLRVYNILDSFYAEVAGQGAFDDSNGQGYLIQCDGNNNTSLIIDSNKLAVDIFIHPTRTIEYIELGVIVTRTGVNFSEVVK